MTSNEQSIKIAADSVEKLREQDVYRVLDMCADPQSVAEYITSNRSDLADEVSIVMAELAEELPRADAA
jgi:hypothetical protein